MSIKKHVVAWSREGPMIQFRVREEYLEGRPLAELAHP